MAFEGLGEITFRRRALPGCLTIREVQEVVERRFGVSHADLIGECRKKMWAYPRQVAMYLCREYTRKSYPEIARAFSDRDHTTILFGWRKMNAAADEATVSDLAELRTILNAMLRERGIILTPPVGYSDRTAEANELLMCAA